jgi:ribosome-binding protein aMBF1 (putative translation factor)
LWASPMSAAQIAQSLSPTTASLSNQPTELGRRTRDISESRYLSSDDAPPRRVHNARQDKSWQQASALSPRKMTTPVALISRCNPINICAERLFISPPLSHLILIIRRNSNH